MGRKLLAQKLSALSFLFEPSQVFESLWPLLQTLWNDDVAEVREATISAPAALIVQLNGSGHPEWAKSIINQLVVMARAHTWLPRLLFCRSCHALVTAVEPDMFIETGLGGCVRSSPRSSCTVKSRRGEPIADDNDQG